MARRTTLSTPRRPEDQRGESRAEIGQSRHKTQVRTAVAKPKKATTRSGRLQPLAAHAVAVFGDEKKAAHWFITPLALLGGRSPEEVFDGKGGAALVDRILTRIEHNIPS
jgi:uncharacterized protein (DUF2384 family)